MKIIAVDVPANYATKVEMIDLISKEYEVDYISVVSMLNSNSMTSERIDIEKMGDRVNIKSDSVTKLKENVALFAAKTQYLTSNEQVTVNGNPTQGSEPVYFGMVGDSFTAQCDIVDSEGALQTQLDQVTQGYPTILALPVVKVIAGDIAKAVDEVYMNTTLVNGVLTAIGKFPTAGNWVLAKERVNMALGEIGSDWRVNIQDFSFRIVEKQS